MRASWGRTTWIIATTKIADRAMVSRARPEPWARAMATTTASMHQALMSSTAAQVRVTAPRGVL